MIKKRAQRSETMIALRARRQAFTIANEIRNPPVGVGTAICPQCHAEAHVVDSGERRALRCPRCGAQMNWPSDFVYNAKPVVGSVHLEAEDAPPGAVFVGCMNCCTEQWFRSVDEVYGVYCALCDHELVPAADFVEHRNRVAFEQRKREVFYAASAIVIILLLFAIGIVLILGSTRGI